MRQRHLLWLAVVIPVGLVVLIAAFGVAWLAAPQVGDLQARVRALESSTGASPVKLEAVSPVMREAVVATEDERFYAHDGVDVIGLLRALPYDLSHLSLAQGASTITEQLAKQVYLGGNDRNPWAKLQDAAIALRIESRFSKDQILGDYLNTADFGPGAAGVQAASRHYFGVPPSQLTLSRASLLAGLIQDPSAYDPLAHPRDARERQVEVLRSMVRNGFVTAREATRALASPLALIHRTALPPVRGTSVEPGPAFYWRGFAAGILAFVLGIAGLVAIRRHRERLSGLLLLSLRAAVLVIAAGGVLIVFASFRTA